MLGFQPNLRLLKIVNSLFLTQGNINMETKDYITLFLAIVGTILGLYNSIINYKKEKREKEKIEQDKLNKEYERDMSILKNALRGYEEFINIFIDMVEKGKKDKTTPIKIYNETRLIHLATIPYQNYKFDYMKKALKSKNNEVEELLKKIAKIRDSIAEFRKEFKAKSEVNDAHIAYLKKIRTSINQESTRYLY